MHDKVSYLPLLNQGFSGMMQAMEDGHFLSFATISLGIVLFFVLSLGGVFIYLFLRGPQTAQIEEKSNKSEERI